METLARWHDGGGPGPWALLFPVVWAALVVGGIFLLRRTVWRARKEGGGAGRGPWGQRGSWGPPQTAATSGYGAAQGTETPLGLLDRRFAKGEIDEDEYWRRYSVLNESARERHDGSGEDPAGSAR